MASLAVVTLVDVDPLIPEGMETVTQAALRIQRSPRFVRNLVRDKVLRPYTVKGVRDTLIKTEDLNRLLQPRPKDGLDAG